MYFDDIENDSCASMITKPTYHSVSISTIIYAQKHLSFKVRNTLSIMLKRFIVLVDSILKVYPLLFIHLDNIPNATPQHLCDCPVAYIHIDVFKAELSFLCYINVF